jgi:hypothetical protein
MHTQREDENYELENGLDEVGLLQTTLHMLESSG